MGGFGEHWWAQRWIAALESLGWESRLQRGKRYARASRVVELEVRPGKVDARVQGSRYEPYRVRFRVETLNQKQWNEVIRVMAGQAIFAAKLLAGEMPLNIEEAFETAGLALFPVAAEDLRTTCTCPDVANPCKHVAAVHYLLAQQFDEDPFLLFRLRGRGRSEILEALQKRRTSDGASRVKSPTRRPAEKRSPLRQSVEGFWRSGADLGNLPVVVSPPPIWTALLKRLGTPPFWKGEPEIRLAMERLYAKVTERAMAVAYGGRGMSTDPTDDPAAD
jgi:uncharacterized Zn finger protein